MKGLEGSFQSRLWKENRLEGCPGLHKPKDEEKTTLVVEEEIVPGYGKLCGRVCIKAKRVGGGREGHRMASDRTQGTKGGGW